MNSSTRFRYRPLLTLAAVLGCLGASACVPTADGGPVDRTAMKAAKKAKKGPAGRRPVASRMGATAGSLRQPSRDLADYTRRTGYIVKGTDFLTFWPCGESGYHFMLTAQQIVGRISQQYRLGAPRPYAAIYGELRVRYVTDTITVGANHYDHYVEVIDYKVLARENATCSGPTRSDVSSAMRTLEHASGEGR
ncbi:MAG: hypothetical protein ABIZ91_08365 [Gemmatimonadaceae bacterium]